MILMPSHCGYGKLYQGLIGAVKNTHAIGAYCMGAGGKDMAR